MLRPATNHDARAIADVYWSSRQTFLGYAPLAHSFAEVRHWIAHILLVHSRVWVEDQVGRVVGFVAAEVRDGVGWIDQLYLAPETTGRGIGQRLLAQALEELPRPVRLFTFQANEGARRFYERHGFVALATTDGSANEEHCPDVLYELK